MDRRDVRRVLRRKRAVQCAHGVEGEGGDVGDGGCSARGRDGS